MYSDRKYARARVCRPAKLCQELQQPSGCRDSVENAVAERHSRIFLGGSALVGSSIQAHGLLASIANLWQLLCGRLEYSLKGTCILSKGISIALIAISINWLFAGERRAL